MKNYDKEIADLENQIKILKEEKKEHDFLMPVHKLAELIHEKYVIGIILMGAHGIMRNGTDLIIQQDKGILKKLIRYYKK